MSEKKLVVCFMRHCVDSLQKMEAVMKTADDILLEDYCITDPFEIVRGDYPNMRAWLTAFIETYMDRHYPKFDDKLMEILEPLRKAGKKIYPVDMPYTGPYVFETKTPGFLSIFTKRKVKRVRGILVEEANIEKRMKKNMREKLLDKVVNDMIILAQEDAKLMTIRDDERLRWIWKNKKSLNGTTFIEAGGLHTRFFHELKKLKGFDVESVLLDQEEIIKVFGKRVTVFAPQDEITMIFQKKRKVSEKKLKDLAVQAIFYAYFVKSDGSNFYEAVKKAREYSYSRLNELLAMPPKILF